jgi:carbamoyltransferase
LNVLGLNFHHDTSACLITGGRIIAAEEERWSGLKHHRSVRDQYLTAPEASLAFCLEAGGIDAAEVDAVLAPAMAPYRAPGDRNKERAATAALLPAVLGAKLQLVSHHLAHLMSAWPLSGWEEAAGLVVDAGGTHLGPGFDDRERISGFHLHNGRAEQIFANAPARPAHSLGHFYRNLAVRCILPGDEPEGSMMALAAFGDPDRYRPALEQWIRLEAEGQVRITAPLGRYDLDSPLEIGDRAWSRASAGEVSETDRSDLAAAAQAVFEVALIHTARHLREATGSPRLVFAGGCALNSKLNGRLAEAAGFDEVYIAPAPHDAGTAVGAAWIAVPQEQWPRQRPIDADWGPEPGPFVCPPGWALASPGPVHRTAAGLLARGAVIGWVQGGLEFGPRALGHRSILAHPGAVATRKRVNAIKQRADFRPLAPAVLAEYARDWFTARGDAFMNTTATARHCKADRVGAVVHADGTARLQAVHAGHTGLRELLEAFGGRTGVPVLLNTSFNRKGAPILRTAAQAAGAAADLDLDALVCGDQIALNPRSTHLED